MQGAYIMRRRTLLEIPEFSLLEPGDTLRFWLSAPKTRLLPSGRQVSFEGTVSDDGIYIQTQNEMFEVCGTSKNIMYQCLSMSNNLICRGVYSGSLLDHSVCVDFFQQAQRLVVAWLKYARLHKDIKVVIGKLLLSTWNDLETWIKFVKIKKCVRCSLRQSLGKFTLAAWSAGVTCWKRRISAEASRDATRGPALTFDGLSTRHTSSNQSYFAPNMRLTPRLNMSITICGEKHQNCRALARRRLKPWHSATALRKALAAGCMYIL